MKEERKRKLYNHHMSLCKEGQTMIADDFFFKQGKRISYCEYLGPNTNRLEK